MGKSLLDKSVKSKFSACVVQHSRLKGLPKSRYMHVELFSTLLHLLSFNQSEIKSSANQYNTPLDPELSAEQ